MLRKIWSLAELVIIDGLRRHALMGLIFLALGLEAGGLLFFDFIPRDIGRASGDFILTIGWLTGFLFLLFHAVQVIAWDEERRTIHTLLARPISRTQYVLGVFLGLSVLLMFLNSILAILGCGILVFIKNSVGPVHFLHLSLFHYFLSWIGLFCIELLILSVILLFSGLVRGGFPVLIITVAYYFICIGMPVVRSVFLNSTDELHKKINITLKWLTLAFPDFSRFDFKRLITNDSIDVFFKYFYIDIANTILYIVITLWLASFIYQRRDLQ